MYQYYLLFKVLQCLIKNKNIPALIQYLNEKIVFQQFFYIDDKYYLKINGGTFSKVIYFKFKSDDQIIYSMKIFKTMDNNTNNIKKNLRSLKNQLKELVILQLLSNCQHIIQLVPTVMVQQQFSGLVLCFKKAQFTLIKYIENNKFTDQQLQMILEDITFQILDAICQMHQKNIAHRDIKPENIMYDSEKQWCLIDCSESKIYFSVKGKYSIKGSTPYLPEEIKNAYLIGSKKCYQDLFWNDIYALIQTLKSLFQVLSRKFKINEDDFNRLKNQLMEIKDLKILQTLMNNYKFDVSKKILYNCSSIQNETILKLDQCVGYIQQNDDSQLFKYYNQKQNKEFIKIYLSWLVEQKLISDVRILFLFFRFIINCIKEEKIDLIKQFIEEFKKSQDQLTFKFVGNNNIDVIFQQSIDYFYQIYVQEKQNFQSTTLKPKLFKLFKDNEAQLDLQIFFLLILDTIKIGEIYFNQNIRWFKKIFIKEKNNFNTNSHSNSQTINQLIGCEKFFQTLDQDSILLDDIFLQYLFKDQEIETVDKLIFLASKCQFQAQYEYYLYILVQKTLYYFQEVYQGLDIMIRFFLFETIKQNQVIQDKIIDNQNLSNQANVQYNQMNKQNKLQIHQDQIQFVVKYEQEFDFFNYNKTNDYKSIEQNQSIKQSINYNEQYQIVEEKSVNKDNKLENQQDKNQLVLTKQNKIINRNYFLIMIYLASTADEQFIKYFIKFNKCNVLVDFNQFCLLLFIDQFIRSGQNQKVLKDFLYRYLINFRIAFVYTFLFNKQILTKVKILQYYEKMRNQVIPLILNKQKQTSKRFLNYLLIHRSNLFIQNLINFQRLNNKEINILNDINKVKDDLFIKWIRFSKFTLE